MRKLSRGQASQTRGEACQQKGEACQHQLPLIVREIEVINPSNLSLSYTDIKSAARQARASSSRAAPRAAEEAVLIKLHLVDECNLVFLSARPHVHKDVSEQASYRVFERLVHARRLHIMPSLLPGSLWPGLQAILCAKCSRGAWHATAVRKFNSFLTYARLYPEYEFIFVGDNGQGDVFAAELMMNAGVPVKACFIHEVVPLHKTFTSLAKPSIEDWAARKIFFFKSYVGAALAALDAGLLHASSLAEVVLESLEDFHTAQHVQARTHDPTRKKSRVRPSSYQVTDVAWQQLCADVHRANEVLEKSGLQPIRLDRPPDSNDDDALVTANSAASWDDYGYADEDDDCLPLHPVCPSKELESEDLEAQVKSASDQACETVGPGTKAAESSDG